MVPWTVVVFTLTFLLLLSSSLLIGLVENNILQDTDTCCTAGDIECARAVAQLQDGFYNFVYGMRTRYTISTSFLIFSLVLRCCTLPDSLASLQHPYTTAFVALLAFYMLLSVNGLVTHFYADRNDILFFCKTISEPLLSWLELISAFTALLAVSLFYLFIISQDNNYSYSRAPSAMPLEDAGT